MFFRKYNLTISAEEIAQLCSVHRAHHVEDAYYSKLHELIINPNEVEVSPEICSVNRWFPSLEAWMDYYKIADFHTKTEFFLKNYCSEPLTWLIYHLNIDVTNDQNLRQLFMHKLKFICHNKITQNGAWEYPDTFFFYFVYQNIEVIKMCVTFHDTRFIFELIKFLDACEKHACIIDETKFNNIRRFVINSFFTPERPLTSLLQILNFFIEIKNNRAIAYFDSKNTLPITMELCETSNLNSEENNEIIFDYKKHFQSSEICNEPIEKFISSEWKSDEKKTRYFEKIKVGSKFIGGNLYEIILLPDEPNLIIFHISCIFIHESMRGKGITNPLIFTLPLALKEKFKDKTIICVFQSLSVGSFNLVKGLPFYPKYTNSYLDQLARKIFPHIQPYGKLKQGPMVCYSEIKVGMKITENKSNTQKDPSINELLLSYFKDTELNKETHRGVLIMLLVNSQLQNQYRKYCKKMNFSGENHVHQVSEKILSFFMKRLSDRSNSPPINNSNFSKETSLVKFRGKYYV